MGIVQQNQNAKAVAAGIAQGVGLAGAFAAQAAKSAGGTSTDDFVELFSFLNSPAKGLVGIGTIVNSSAAHSGKTLVVKETGKMLDGTEDSVETEVAEQGSMMLTLSSNIGDVTPPFQEYSVAVKSGDPGNHATFTYAASAVGQLVVVEPE